MRQSHKMKKSGFLERFSRNISVIIISVFACFLVSCAHQVNHHGNILTDEEIKQVRPGMGKDQVKLALGTPATTSTVGGGAFYYISSTQKHYAFLKPKVVNRRVVVVYFNKTEEVQRLANYGLKDGKLYDFISRKTPTHRGEDSILQSIFAGVGAARNAIGGGPGSSY